MQDKMYWEKRFRAVGIAGSRIINEIWRAHYLDQLLFSNPVNKAYGVDETIIYQAMKKTQERFGVFDGDAEAYVRVYSTAMAAPPHMFAPSVQWRRSSSLRAWWRTWGAGKTALVWNADCVMGEWKAADDIFGIGRVYALVDSEETARCWQAVYPEVRWITREDLGGQQFEYIHVMGEDAKAFEDFKDACRYIETNGVVTGMVSWATYQSEGAVEDTLRLAETRKGNWPYIWLVYGAEAGIATATYRSGEWRIDRNNAAATRYLSSADKLRIGDLACRAPVEMIHEPLAWVADAQISNEYLTSPTRHGIGRGYRLQAGDIIVTAHGDNYRVALVPIDYPVAATSFPVLRPLDKMKGRQLFGILLQESTRRQLATLSKNEKISLEDCVWEWLPLEGPLPTDAQLKRLDEALQALARARQVWQETMEDI